MASFARRTLALAISGPVTRADIPGLCRRVGALLEHSGATVALCDVRELDADAVTVDALARLALAARRHRAQIRLRHPSDELVELLALIGLGDVLGG